MEILGLGVILSMFALAGVYAFLRRSRRGEEQGFRYVYVNDDGSARELVEHEKDYLNTCFEHGDRPYIKFRYESLTADGRMNGLLERRLVPANIQISPAPFVESLPPPFKP